MTINRIQPETPWNSDLWLEFDPDEPLDETILRKLGFRLAKDDAGNIQYKASENVQQEVLNQAMFAGFPVDQQNTYRLRFKKDDWFGDFGAYTQRAFEGRPNLSIDLATRLGFENRPAFTINVDTRFHKPLLAMEQFTAGLTGGGDLSAPISGFIEFKHHLYCSAADRHVYQLVSWGAPGAATWTQVFQHSVTTAVLRDLIVYNDVMYVAAGETAAYAYTADGTTWVESNRTVPTDDDKAEQFRVINGFLHKIRVPNLHYETTDGRNSGGQWFGPDAIGESQADITAFELLGQNNSTLFAKEEGVFNLPEDGQVQDLYPELQKSREPGNGFHAFVWNQKLLYPTFKGELVGLFDGRKVELTPALRQERRLELDPAISGFLGRIRAMAGTTDYLFVELKKNDTDEYRLLVLEERGGAFVWRTLLNLESTTSDELFVSSDATAGPVLWATFNNVAAYWILPVGPDPLQDNRSRFTGSGTLYEPWLDFGLPTIDKRWSSITFEVAGQSGQTLVMTAVLGDGTTYTRTMTLGVGVTYTRFLFPKGFIHKRLRLELELTTDDDTSTPALISYEIKAYALPPPIRQFQFVVEAMEKGERGGMATQDEMRQHLLALRGAVFPLTYKDPYQRLWPVLHFPPAPFEDTTHNPDLGRWDENWTVMLLEEPTREFELIHGPPPGLVTDVSVSKVCGPSPLDLGIPGPHNITSTITVHNAGPATAQGVIVTEVLPTGTSFVSADHGGVVIGSAVVWNLGNMTSGQTIVLTLVVHVADDVTTDITDTVNVSVASPENVSTSTSDSCTVTVIRSFRGIVIQVGGSDGVGDTAHFAFTLNALAPTPTWIENSLGLPVIDGRSGFCYYDPFDAGHKAVIGLGSKIWRNTDYQNLASPWVEVFDGGVDASIRWLSYTIAEEGRVYAAYYDSGTGQWHVIHSHDGGATWPTDTAVAVTASGYGFLQVSQWNADVVYVNINPTFRFIYKSTDGGHTFSIINSDGNGVPVGLTLLYVGNSADLLVYGRNQGSFTEVKSTTGAVGSSFANVGTVVLGGIEQPIFVSAVDAAVFYHNEGYLDGLLRATFDEFATEGTFDVGTVGLGFNTGGAGFGDGRQQTSLLGAEHWYIGGRAINPGVDPYVITLDYNLTNPVNRTGNLASLLGTGSNKSVGMIQVVDLTA